MACSFYFWLRKCGTGLLLQVHTGFLFTSDYFPPSPISSKTRLSLPTVAAFRI
uniref:Uncharacterized protein n=1 Tax=Anguilla anguilla TaxID=7936 RepID=A0A0E9SGR6_ANGAN